MKFSLVLLTTLTEVPEPGAPSQAMLPSDLIKDTCSISPTLGHGISRLARNVKR